VSFSAWSRFQLTHRCHHKTFLLEFARDRRRYLRWVFEAKKRFGLPVLIVSGRRRVMGAASAL